MRTSLFAIVSTALLLASACTHTADQSADESSAAKSILLLVHPELVPTALTALNAMRVLEVTSNATALDSKTWSLVGGIAKSSHWPKGEVWKKQTVSKVRGQMVQVLRAAAADIRTYAKRVQLDEPPADFARAVNVRIDGTDRWIPVGTPTASSDAPERNLALFYHWAELVLDPSADIAALATTQATVSGIRRAAEPTGSGLSALGDLMRGSLAVIRQSPPPARPR